MLILLSVALALLAAAYTLWLQPILLVLGVNRTLTPVGNTGCRAVPELSACEKIVLHAPTGLLYLACSSPQSRAHWTPAVSQLNASFVPEEDDFIAVFNPENNVVTRLAQTAIPLALHGMDVVPSASDPSDLFVYAINHRRPSDPKSASGADSTVEVFLTKVGSKTLTHLHTVRDAVIVTPNDIVGSPDGQSFFFTNDHATKTSPMRYLALIGAEKGSVGYCDINAGCKFVVRKMHGANGIARSPENNTFFVANSIFGGITVLERQSDNALLQTHHIPTDRGLDNLSIDSEGVLWAAGIPYMLSILQHIADPSKLSPGSALAVAQNIGPGSFYGEKYQVTKVLEDDGKVACGTTVVVRDSQRKRLFLHGERSVYVQNHA